MKYKFLYIGIAIFLILYSILFIYKASIILQGKRHYLLLDDMMISMRYAKNLAHGNGLVWNPGEKPVMGYTNFLWTAYMAVIHLLPIDTELIILLVSLSGMLFLLFNLFVVKKITELVTDKPYLPMMTVLLTATYYSLNTLALVGSEVSILTLLLGCTVYLEFKLLKTQKFTPFPYLILGISFLIRMDMIMLISLMVTIMIFLDKKNRKNHLFIGIPILIGFILFQILFNYVYYRDLLPNTYYLKLTGYNLLLRISRGIYTSYIFILQSNWFLLLLPFILFLRRGNLYPKILYLMFFIQLAYSTYVGGDVWEYNGANRYEAIVMPLFFISFIISAQYIFTFLNKEIDYKKIKLILPIIFIVFCILNFNNIRDYDHMTYYFLRRSPPILDSHQDKIAFSKILKSITLQKAKIAVVSAGIIPYYLDRTFIDLLGKNDSYIAKLNVSDSNYDQGTRRFIDFNPGHTKWDYAYSIGILKPDVIAQTVWMPTQSAVSEAQKYLAQYKKVNIQGYDLYLKKDSTNIIWKKIY